MAKSKSFFGLRTGSTKSATFSIYRGEQITKDRVEKVANPQTSAQMLQRMKLAQVAAATARLEGLVNHSFEGVPYGYQSVGEFRRRNLENGALNVARWIPKGMADPGVADYVISSGTLVPFNSVPIAGAPSIAINILVEKFFNGFENQGVALDKMDLPAIMDFEYTTKAFDGFFEENPYLQGGDQITFLLQGDLIKSEITWPNKYNTGFDSTYRTGFIVSRFILPHKPTSNGAPYYYNTEEEKEMKQWKVTATQAGSSVTFGLTNGYVYFSALGAADAPTGFTNGKNLEVGLTSLQQTYFSHENLVAGCTILSRKDGAKDTWRRSSARLSLYDDIDNNFDACDYTYLKSTTADKKYLNTGTQPTGIVGQSV